MVLVGAGAVHWLCSTAWAIDASNVLVLYNTASPDGMAIADYYAQVHPGAQLLGLNNVPTTDDITADTYLSTIRPQVMAALTPKSDVIVTTKGLPLRVNVTEAEPTSTWPALPSYVDPSGTTRQILNWKTTSSLESELTTVDKVSTWQMMGDQSYVMSGQFSMNPYYHSTASFSHAAFGTRLTSRLDGYTASDVEASIDRAQNAFIGPANTPNGPFHFLVDNDPSKTYATTMTSLVNNVLKPAGLPLTYDNTSAFVGTTTGPVIAYDSHGANQASTPANYIANGLNITLANGAVFTTWESYNAQSFTVGGQHGNQGLVADWLAKGGTAGVGNVAEPGASASSVINEDQMFMMLLAGKTFAEAAWSGAMQLSYVNTVVGDSLMTWKQLLPGDVNMGGKVDGLDLAIITTDWGRSVTCGGAGWSLGDLNGDGVIDMSDLALVSNSGGEVSSWASGTALNSVAPGDLNTAGGSDSGQIPEPSSLVLLALGAAAVLAFRRRQARQLTPRLDT